MDKKKIINKAEEFARVKMKSFDPGHDWWHIRRVRKLAEKINSEERSADPFELDIAAILHDVADSKFSNNSDKYGELEDFLSTYVSADSENRILTAIKNISFSNKNPQRDLAGPLYFILQDADRLDAIGAVGVARAFSYGSFKGNRFFEPSSETGGKPGTTIHHFYDKLLKLKDMMNTEEGKRLAEERHKFLGMFLEQFYKEWNV